MPKYWKRLVKFITCLVNVVPLLLCSTVLLVLLVIYYYMYISLDAGEFKQVIYFTAGVYVIYIILLTMKQLGVFKVFKAEITALKKAMSKNARR